MLLGFFTRFLPVDGPGQVNSDIVYVYMYMDGAYRLMLIKYCTDAQKSEQSIGRDVKMPLLQKFDITAIIKTVLTC